MKATAAAVAIIACHSSASIVSHVFRALESSHKNVVNTFARSNVYVSAPSPHRVANTGVTIYLYIFFPNTHSHLNAQSINVSRAIVFGRPSSSAEQSSILCRSSTLAVPFRWYNNSNRIEYLDVRFSGVVRTRLLRRHKLLCVAFCIVLFFFCLRGGLLTQNTKIIMNWPVKTRTRTPAVRRENKKEEKKKTNRINKFKR